MAEELEFIKVPNESNIEGIYEEKYLIKIPLNEKEGLDIGFETGEISIPPFKSLGGQDFTEKITNWLTSLYILSKDTYDLNNFPNFELIKEEGYVIIGFDNKNIDISKNILSYEATILFKKK